MPITASTVQDPNIPGLRAELTPTAVVYLERARRNSTVRRFNR